MNIKIAPSILSADFANLERDIRKIDTADYVHVDIMDGEFVPNISIGIPVVKAIRPVSGLPLDVHLMITKPVRYVEQFCTSSPTSPRTSTPRWRRSTRRASARALCSSPTPAPKRRCRTSRSATSCW